MTIYAAVSEISSTRLWGLDSARRLQRQLREISKSSAAEFGEIVWLDDIYAMPENQRILLISGNFLFESRTLAGVLARPDTVLQHPAHLSAAAVLIEAHRLPEVLAYFNGESSNLPAGLHTMQPGDMAAFDESLRRSTTPLLEPLSAQRKTELENKLYGNAYRGITDLVTKFLWPRPAKRMVHLCANLGVTPNMVTTAGLFLVLAACYLFWQGQYGLGLLAGWLMTFLDTVDGKLARVTVKSSKFGHLFDHGIDLFHPPFWYIYWGMSLQNFQPVLGFDQGQMYWLIVIAYVVGRLVEGVFPLLGNCSIFTWRPYDAWFRLVTARRNPNLILLTLSVLIAKPDWGFIAVTFWSVITTVMLLARLLYGTFIRLKQGPLDSWLSEENVATGPNARAYAIFGATRGAYAR
jgi:phosphatidylglycerophosphate synthase